MKGIGGGGTINHKFYQLNNRLLLLLVKNKDYFGKMHVVLYIKRKTVIKQCYNQTTDGVKVPKLKNCFFSIL